jgi:SAM-dependent methyltransferase
VSVGQALRPLRRFLSRFALVDEKQEAVRREMRELANEVRVLRGELARVQRENSAVLRLVAGPKLNSVVGGVADTPESGAGEWPAVLVLPGASGVGRQALFAELERGSRAGVMAKLESYLPLFGVREPVVDLGCGRGEFLELATAHGLSAYGVDTDADAVAGCRTLGLDAREEDLFEHLAGLAEASRGGVFCSQVVEHLPPDLLSHLLDEIARVLAPGGVAVIETPNPATFATHVQSFWRDPTHIRPVPAAALAFAARTAGLVVQTTIYSSLPPEAERLKPLDARAQDPTVQAVIQAFNGLTEQLNELLYGFQDYALVLVKPE